MALSWRHSRVPTDGLSVRGGGASGSSRDIAGVSPSSTIFSRSSDKNMLSRAEGAMKDGDNKKAAIVAMAVLGASIAGAVLFSYCHPRGRKWKKHMFGAPGAPATTYGMTTNTPEAAAAMRARANDRALKNLGVRELNLEHLPEGAQIVNLPTQVGGHKMMKAMQSLLLLEWEGKGPGGRPQPFVLKILHDGGRGLVELGFYEKLAAHVEGPGAQGEDPRRTQLAGFLCPYFGAVKVVVDAHTDDEGKEVPESTMHFLVLQDMCNGLDNPCALDVKMGRTTVEPGEREEKKIRQLRKYPNQNIVGFRYVGMTWSSFFEGDQEPVKVSKDKTWGASMLVEGSGAGLATFFHDGRSLRRGRVLCALRKIRDVADFFTHQKIFKFYASSLLMTYDGADPPPETPGAEEEVEVRMIDFAHAVPVDGDGEMGEGPAEAPGDEGYLYGILNLASILEELLEVTAGSEPPVTLAAITQRLEYMGRVKTGFSPLQNLAST